VDHTDRSGAEYIVVREMTADVCQRTEMRVTPPLPLAEAERRARRENASAMPDIRYVIRPWSDWQE
jgi:hypothetical protein